MDIDRAREALNRLLEEAGYPSEGEESRQFLRYCQILEKWSARVNLVGSTEWHTLGPLFQEAVWASALYPDRSRRHLDVGSGAGFPAVPLRILRPRMQLDLVESRERRAIFLETLVRDLGLTDVRVHHARLESFLSSQGDPSVWDCVSWKALRLSSRELRALLRRTSEQSQFWLFHGERLPTDDLEWLESHGRLLRRERCAYYPRWLLSIYQPRNTPPSGTLCFT